MKNSITFWLNHKSYFIIYVSKKPMLFMIFSNKTNLFRILCTKYRMTLNLYLTLNDLLFLFWIINTLIRNKIILSLNSMMKTNICLRNSFFLKGILIKIKYNFCNIITIKISCYIIQQKIILVIWLNFIILTFFN